MAYLVTDNIGDEYSPLFLHIEEWDDEDIDSDEDIFATLKEAKVRLIERISEEITA